MRNTHLSLATGHFVPWRDSKREPCDPAIYPLDKNISFEIAFRRLCERGWTESTEVFEKRNFFLSPKFFLVVKLWHWTARSPGFNYFLLNWLIIYFPFVGSNTLISTFAVFSKGSKLNPSIAEILHYENYKHLLLWLKRTSAFLIQLNACSAGMCVCVRTRLLVESGVGVWSGCCFLVR